MSKNTLHPTWISVARVGLIMMTLFLLALFVAGTPYRFLELQTICDVEHCPLMSLSSLEAPILASWSMTLRGYAIFHFGIELAVIIINIVIVSLIYMKYFDNLMGIITAYFLVAFGLSGFVHTDSALFNQYPHYEGIYGLVMAIILMTTLSFVFVFPNGQFIPRSFRWSPIILAIVGGLDPFLKRFGESASSHHSLILGFALFVVAAIGVVTQVIRYRHFSNAVERQQAKWVLLGFILFAISMIGWNLLTEFITLRPGRSTLLFNTIGYLLVYVLYLCLPLSMAFAVVRYRLWDIDLIIRRTLKYSIVSGILAAVYFLTVALSQSVITAVGGQPSSVIIVLSTLLVAALFNPLRTRIQTLIDRRFYRSSYDAQAMLARFSETARDEVELEKLTAGLVQVVQETMQPESVSVWLKEKV